MKKSRFFTPTFTKFFFGFLFIIGIAFAVMLVATNLSAPAAPVDNIATPQ